MKSLDEIFKGTSAPSTKSSGKASNAPAAEASSSDQSLESIFGKTASAPAIVNRDAPVSSGGAYEHTATEYAGLSHEERLAAYQRDAGVDATKEANKPKNIIDKVGSVMDRIGWETMRLGTSAIRGTGSVVGALQDTIEGTLEGTLGKVIDSATGTPHGSTRPSPSLEKLSNQAADWLDTNSGLSGQEKDFISNVVEGLGSSLPYIAGGAAAKLGGVAPLLANLGFSGLEALQNAHDDYTQMIEKGVSKKDALARGAGDFVANLGVNYVSNKLGGFFEKADLNGGLWSATKKFLATTASETGQEGLQQIVSNITNGDPMFNGVGKTLLVSAPVSAIFGAVGVQNDYSFNKEFKKGITELTGEVAKAGGTVDDVAKILTATSEFSENDIKTALDKELENSPEVKQSLEDNRTNAITTQAETLLKDEGYLPEAAVTEMMQSGVAIEEAQSAVQDVQAKIAEENLATAPVISNTVEKAGETVQKITDLSLENTASEIADAIAQDQKQTEERKAIETEKLKSLETAYQEAPKGTNKRKQAKIALVKARKAVTEQTIGTDTVKQLIKQYAEQNHLTNKLSTAEFEQLNQEAFRYVSQPQYRESVGDVPLATVIEGTFKRFADENNGRGAKRATPKKAVNTKVETEKPAVVEPKKQEKVAPIEEKKPEQKKEEVKSEEKVPKKPIEPEKVAEHNMFEKAFDMKNQQTYERTKRSVERIGKELDEAKAMEPAIKKIPRLYKDRTAEQRDLLNRYNALTDQRQKEFYEFWTAKSPQDESMTRLEALKNPTEAKKTSYRVQYIKDVKEYISKGYDIPQAMIDQFPELKLAASARARYEKGYKTSFANKSAAIDETTKEQYGFKVKRQDGKPIDAEQVQEITNAAQSLEDAIGPYKDIAEKLDLTVAHTSGKYPFLRGDAGGLHIGKENTISIGVKKIKAFAHEMFHVIDQASGTMAEMRSKHYATGGEYDTALMDDAKQNMNGSSLQIERSMKAKPNMTAEEKEMAQIMKARLSGYYRTTPEIFARLAEQYVAEKNGKATEASDAPEFYHSALGYWDKETFNRLMPKIEAEIQRKTDLARTKLETTPQAFGEKKAPVQKENTPPVKPQEPESEKKNKEAGLAKRLQVEALKAGLESLGPLRGFESITKADQLEKSVALVNEDYERVKRIVIDGEEVPAGYKSIALWTALKNAALAKGDFETIRDLGTNSPVTEEISLAAQSLGLVENNQEDPVFAVKKVKDVRKKNIEQKLKDKGTTINEEKKKIVEKIKTEVKKKAPSRGDWSAFIKEIQC